MKLFTILWLCVVTSLPGISWAQSTMYNLDISNTQIELGESIDVNWKTDATQTTRDWVGLYRTNARDTAYLSWKYVTSPDGSFTFTPTQPGEYEFRYFLNNGYTKVETSQAFTVTMPDAGSIQYELVVTNDMFEAGDQVTVRFETNANSISQDWIGLYRPIASNQSYLQWQRVTAKGGELAFTITEPGEYEFRYFLTNGYERVARSSPFTVSPETPAEPSLYKLQINADAIERGDEVTVTWDTTNRTSTRDWVGLFRTNSSPTSYLNWTYITDDTGSYTVQINQTGTYEFRYYLDNGYTLAATSDAFTVEPPSGSGDDTTNGYSLTVNQTSFDRGDTARVTWNVPAGEYFFRNWIGMYRPGDTDRQYIKYEYVDVFSRTETFRLDTDGMYEFRFFTNNSYNRVATSDQITVLNDTTALCTLDTSTIANLPTKSGPIIAFGDSITFGIGASAGEDYVSELEDRLGSNIVNAGVSGDTTRDALDRLEDDVLDRNPAAVIVFLGGNDEIRRFYAQLSDTLAGRNLQDQLDNLATDIGYNWMDIPLIPRQETFDNIKTIVDRIQDTGAATIIVGFDAPIYDSRIDDDYRRIAAETDSFFVADIYDDIFGRPRFMSDLVHPNDAGYDIVADRIQPAVACVL